MEIFKDTTGVWVLGEYNNPPSCTFKVADDILIIESCYNRKLFYAGKITDIQLKDENGDFHYCTDEVDFKNKIKDIPFLSSPTLNLGIANY